MNRVPMNPTRCRTGEAGLVLLEVLIAAVAVGIAAVGVALLLSSGHTFIVAQGGNRVALYLAEQKIEMLIAAGFPAVPLNNVLETKLRAGLNGPLSGTQTFNRVTCVNFVQDDDPKSPPDCGTPCAGGTCTGKTARVTVTVTASDPVTDADLARAQPVSLQTVRIKVTN